MNKYLILAVIASISGCEYKPQKEFDVKAESGEVITFSCPVVDASDSKLLYVIENECMVIKVIEK